MWSKSPFKDLGLEPNTPSEASREKDINFLRKGKRNKWTGDDHNFKTKARGDIKFRPLDDDDSTDSDTEAGHISNGDTRHVNLHPWLTGAGSTTHSSTPTTLEEGLHSHIGGGKDSCREIPPTRLSTGLEGSDLPDYSDHEVDITPDIKSARLDPDWTPRFLQNKVHLPKPQPGDPHTTPPLDQVLSSIGRRGPSQKNPGDPPKRHESPRWQAFWRDVDEKIQNKEIS